MDIFLSVIINLVILAIILPIFYVYIVSRARDRFEKDVLKKAREEVEALVKEFNNIALTRISVLEDAIIRANKVLKDINKIAPEPKKDKTLILLEDRVVQSDKDIEDIRTSSSNDNIENLEVVIHNSNTDKKLDIKVEDNSKEIIKEEVKVKKKELNYKLDSKKEAIEQLKSRLDSTIRKNLYKKVDDENNNFDNEENSINSSILKLYKEGFSKEDIVKKLNCTITEVDIVLSIDEVEN